MDQATIAAAMSKAVGDPTTGLLHDAIPGMAEAVAQALGLQGDDDRGDASEPAKSEKRVVKASETR
jgi:hypothetical protein